MKSKQSVYSKNRSFFTHPVNPLIVLAVLEAVALVRTLAHGRILPADFMALTSLVVPLEVVRHAVWLIIFASAVVYTWRGASTSVDVSTSREVSNSVTWAQVMVLLSAFAVYTAIHLALFARADYDRQRLPFVVVGVCFLIFITVGMLYRQRRAQAQTSRIPFQVELEEEIKDGLKPQD